MQAWLRGSNARVNSFDLYCKDQMILLPNCKRAVVLLARVTHWRLSAQPLFLSVKSLLDHCPPNSPSSFSFCSPKSNGIVPVSGQDTHLLSQSHTQDNLVLQAYAEAQTPKDYNVLQLYNAISFLYTILRQMCHTGLVQSRRPAGRPRQPDIARAIGWVLARDLVFVFLHLDFII